MAESKAARVAILMGSRNDWDVMKPAADTLERLGVGYEVRVISAHRTPGRLVTFVEGAEARGFRAFISWTFQRDGNRLDEVVRDEDMPTSFDYLLTQAVSRIYLDNVDHIQSSWVTQGIKVGQVALGFGADDMGSVMLEENVVSAAGTTHRTSTDELVHLIRALGKTPVQRDTLYRDVKVFA